MSITIFAHTGKTGNEIGGEFVSYTLPFFFFLKTFEMRKMRSKLEMPLLAHEKRKTVGCFTSYFIVLDEPKQSLSGGKKKPFFGGGIVDRGQRERR